MKNADWLPVNKDTGNGKMEVGAHVKHPILVWALRVCEAVVIQLNERKTVPRIQPRPDVHAVK